MAPLTSAMVTEGKGTMGKLGGEKDIFFCFLEIERGTLRLFIFPPNKPYIK